VGLTPYRKLDINRADDSPEERGPQTLFDHEREHILAPGSQRHADSNLVPTSSR
jgi:hypothetical protein